MSASLKRSGTSRRGLSAARCGTGCSAGSSWTSTSPARIPSWPRASTRALPAAQSSRSRSATAPGASPSGRAHGRLRRFGDTIEDLATRDFTVNALARPLAGGALVDPLGGEPDLAARRLRAVGPTVFADDPLRLLRAVRLEDELGFRLDEGDRGARAVLRRARRRAGRGAGLGELERLSPDGFRRADELGLLEPLGLRGGPRPRRPGGHAGVHAGRGLRRAAPGLPHLQRPAPARAHAARCRAAADASPREIHRFRRRTEPWALSALAFLGATDLYDAVRVARAEDAEPLLRGEDVLELGVEPGQRSAVSSSWLRKSERSERSRPGRTRSSSCAVRSAPLDGAADRRGLLHLGSRAYDGGLQGQAQVRVRADRILVVGVRGPVVDEPVAGVEDEHLGRARRGADAVSCVSS